MPRSNEGGGKIYDARASARTSQFRGCRESGGTRFSSLLLEDEREIRKRLGEEERERERDRDRIGKNGKRGTFCVRVFHHCLPFFEKNPFNYGEKFFN